MKWNEEMIRQEMRRLDDLTGFDSSEIPIVFSHSKRCLGSFHVVDNYPEEFCFSKEYFEADDFSENCAYDVIRHEYAHYMDFMLHGYERGQMHGKRWKACCRVVGARPQAYYEHSQNELYLKVEKKDKEEKEAMRAFMDALQPEDRLTHPTFGEGKICSIEYKDGNARVEVEFSGGKRRLAAKWLAENCGLCKGGT